MSSTPRRETAPRRRPPSDAFDGAAIYGAAALAALVSALPVAALLGAAFWRGGGFNPGAALEILGGRSASLALWRSLETGVMSAILAVGLGLAAALTVTLFRFRGRSAFIFLFALSMMVAPQVAALAYLNLAGPSSPLLLSLGLAPAPGTPNPMRSAGGIILVLGLHHAPLAFLTMRAGLIQTPRELIEAAFVDGAGRRQVLLRVILPLLRGHLIAAGLLCFVASVGNFGIPALLGMPVNYLTVPTLIYRRMTSLGPGVLSDMAALSLSLIVLAIIAVALARRLSQGGVRVEAAASIDAMLTPGQVGKLAIYCGLGALLLVSMALPTLALLASALVPTYGVALTPANVTLANFIEALWTQDSTRAAFFNSFLYASIAAGLVATAAAPLAYALSRAGPWTRASVEAIVELPYAIPGVVLAIACILLLIHPLPLIKISLYGTGAIIVFAYCARFLPLAVKPVAASLDRLDPSIEEAAALCGAGRLKRLTAIVAPNLLPAAIAGGLMAFLVGFNELTVSALLWSRGTQTIGVVLFGLEEAGFASQAAAVAIAATAVSALAMLALDWIGRRLPAGSIPWR